MIHLALLLALSQRPDACPQEAELLSLEAAHRLLLLGSVYHAQLRFEEAESCARQAVQLFQTLTGYDSRDYALASANLAVILADEGELARAEPILRRALFLLRLHDSASPDIEEALVEENLAMVCLRQHEFHEAEPLLNDALQKLRASGNISEATVLAALAELSIAEDRWSDATSQIHQALKIIVDRQQEDNTWLIGILRLKASIETHFGDWPQAASDMKRSLDLLDAAAGTNSPRTAMFLDDYARILHHLKRGHEARVVHNRSKAIKSARQNQ